MARAARLAERRIEGLSVGRYSDGGRGSHGLYLLVQTASGGGVRRSWCQRLRIGDRETNIGLGGHPVVTLQMARAKALENKRVTYLGGDPRRGDRLGLVTAHGAPVMAAPTGTPVIVESVIVPPTVPTFAAALDAAIDLKRGGWREGSRTEAKWRAAITQHAGALMDKPVSTITSADVLAALTPIWHSKAKTAKRLRQQISSVFAWAIAQGHIASDPAGDALTAALPKQNGTVEHRAAVDHAKVATTISAIREAEAPESARLALEFVILTATRSGEARGARWEEIDGDVWTVPAERVKMDRPHRVPLSAEALAVLERARASFGSDGLIFRSERTGRELTSHTLVNTLRASGTAATVHGFRSSFRDYAADSGAPREIAEAALAHTVKGVEGAYQRSDLLERRAELMAAWGAYASP